MFQNRLLNINPKILSTADIMRAIKAKITGVVLFIFYCLGEFIYVLKGGDL